jgi:hypothetical protein
MNNLLDYSHMINTYVMCIDFPENNSECNCSEFINCYNSSKLKNCKYYNLIINNLPLFKILINPNIKKKFMLPKKWNNSKLNPNEFFKLMFYIINFVDESPEYIIDKPYIKCIVSLSLYILIINNYNIVKKIIYVFDTLLINMIDKLKYNYLNNTDNVIKLNDLFKKYFKDSSDNCINIMYKWIILMDNLINEN